MYQMNPWFDPSLAWLPGTLLGVIVGLYGAAVGILLPLSRQRGRLIGIGFIRRMYWALLLASAVMLFLGVVAFSQKQPFGVWYGLGLAGIIGVCVLGGNAVVILKLPKRIEGEIQEQNKRVEAARQ